MQWKQRMRRNYSMQSDGRTAAIPVLLGGAVERRRRNYMSNGEPQQRMRRKELQHTISKAEERNETAMPVLIERAVETEEYVQ
jgi:hypothetical protein